MDIILGLFVLAALTIVLILTIYIATKKGKAEEVFALLLTSYIVVGMWIIIFLLTTNAKLGVIAIAAFSIVLSILIYSGTKKEKQKKLEVYKKAFEILSGNKLEDYIDINTTGNKLKDYANTNTIKKCLLETNVCTNGIPLGLNDVIEKRKLKIEKITPRQLPNRHGYDAYDMLLWDITCYIEEQGYKYADVFGCDTIVTPEEYEQLKELDVRR